MCIRDRREMAIELFQPFVIHRLIYEGLVNNIKAAKNIIQNNETLAWEILEQVMAGHPILLNRAPTLHRMGIQAFTPVLVPGFAVHLHPLVCPPFNADFDGDTMAIHLPMSHVARAEAHVLLSGSLFPVSPSSGDGSLLPSQDIVLGIYYLSQSSKSDKPKGVFSNIDEIEQALENKSISLHTKINARVTNSDGDNLKVITTPGRMILGNILPKKQSANQHEDCSKINLDTQTVSELDLQR